MAMFQHSFKTTYPTKFSLEIGQWSHGMLLAATDAATKTHSTKVGVFLIAVKNLE